MEERARDSRNRILEFFNVTDALEVTWAHAVNSQEKLQEALTGEVNMNFFQSGFFLTSIYYKKRTTSTFCIPFII